MRKIILGLILLLGFISCDTKLQNESDKTIEVLQKTIEMWKEVSIKSYEIGYKQGLLNGMEKDSWIDRNQWKLKYKIDSIEYSKIIYQ